MEFRQLRYFAAVARFRSFTRAAEHEHVAQPSLSQQIRKLEDELGARLFDRLAAGVALTELGERFQKHARRVLVEVEGAREVMHEMLGLQQGRVNLGAIPTVAPFLLPQTLQAFGKRHPNIEVNVTEDLTQSLLSQLSEGSLDLALLSSPVRKAEITDEPLFRERMLLAVSASHRLWRERRRSQKHVSLRGLAGERFLLLRDGHCFRDDVLELCRRSRLSPRVVFEGGQFDTLVGMVEAGAGVTLLPETARRHYRRAGVGLLEFAPPEPTRTIGLVRLKDKFVTPATRALIEVLRRLWGRRGLTEAPQW